MTHLIDYTSHIKDFHKYKSNENMPCLSTNAALKAEKKKERVWFDYFSASQNSPDFNSSFSNGWDEDILKTEPSASGRCYMRIH